MSGEPLTPKEISSQLCHGVDVKLYEYISPTLGGTTTRFRAIVPSANTKSPVLYYLSGLTCTTENCTTKGEVAKSIAKYPIVVILPDTSPRGAGAPGEEESWDFGTGAGFYVDATQPGFEAYQMATFIRDELPKAVSEALGEAVDVSKSSITGHSMGGHGALTLALKNPGKYLSVSAFAPITNPSIVDWGIKAFTGYLGEEGWAKWDASELIRNGAKLPDGTLIDQGTSDEFLERLKPTEFAKICNDAGININLKMRQGYDHSYFFIATFMEDHIAYHAKTLLS